MKNFLLFLFCLSAMTCLSQKIDTRKGIYSAHLYLVDGPEEAKTGKVDEFFSVYEDSVIKIDWNYESTQIGFELTNKSDQTLKIIWDDAAFISLNNETNRIFHKGIKYTDRENSQPPTSVYKKTTLSDLIAPTSYTNLVTNILTDRSEWKSDPLIPIKPAYLLSKKIEYIPSLLGLTMQVVLPIKMEDRVLEYIFYFRTEFIPDLESDKKAKH